MARNKIYGVQTLGEEIANSVSHGVGALLGIAGTVVLLVYAALFSNTLGIVASAIYGFSLIELHTMSTLYHSITNEKAKKVFQILDHCSIFLLILGTYTPISLLMIGGTVGFSLFAFNLLLTVLGVVLNSINMKKWHKLSMVFYLLMGWSIVAVWKFIPPVSPSGVALVVAGGIAYTVGIIFYRMKKLKFMHFIWHLFVLAGSILHYFFVLFYIYL
ncbi:MAG: hemolysin III family protein [Ruminococcaceae bacterium]|nr:hemolysin III family protein [Oscillospiraceae bacterium]